MSATVHPRPWEPLGVTQWEYVMGEAALAFEVGLWNEGLQHLAHAAYIGATTETTVDRHEALQRVRKVTGAGWSPDDPTAA